MLGFTDKKSQIAELQIGLNDNTCMLILELPIVAFQFLAALHGLAKSRARYHVDLCGFSLAVVLADGDALVVHLQHL